MKKWIRALALMLSLTMLLSVTALAAGTDPTVEDQAEGATVAFQAGNVKLSVSYSNANIQKGGQYLLLVVKGTADSYTIQEDTILYIDQVQATEEGKVEFSSVYPSSIQNSVVLISGTGLSGPLKLTTITVPYKLGDVNEDGSIDTKDLTRLARYIVGSTKEINVSAADTNLDGSINTKDLTRLAGYLVGGAELG